MAEQRPSHCITVSELTHSIRTLLEPSFRSVKVQGEVSNVKLQGSGHLYFTLKDSQAQIAAVMFRKETSSLTKIPKEGDQIFVEGSLSLYAPRGSYQIVVRSLQYQGEGELWLRFHELKDKLAQRGWFASERKKKLPRFPTTIGVVTSPTGAAIRDILQVLTRRFQGIRVLLCPVKVQGEGAGDEIRDAIELLNRYELADLLIVGRGGGSIEDLWAFNEEVVATAIYESKIPIISAVGHETDVTLSDFVADVRAPTPSAAAELAVRDKQSLLSFLHQAQDRLFHYLSKTCQSHRHALSSLKRHPIFSAPWTLLYEREQKLDSIAHLLDTHIASFFEAKQTYLKGAQERLSIVDPLYEISRNRERLDLHWRSLQKMGQHYLFTLKERLSHMGTLYRQLHPDNLLAQGYCYATTIQGQLISSTHNVQLGDRISITCQDGEIQAIVHATKPRITKVFYDKTTLL
jgi:exodeoxyribonuclease VII large subunit